MDVFEDIRTQLVIRARLHDDEASIALKGHLLSEYLLNRIISEKIAGAKKSNRITYSDKLKLLEKRGLLEEEVLNNLRLLNKFRNKMVHELDVSIRDNEMVFHKPNHEVLQVRPKKGRYPQRQYLRLLSHGVLTQLVNHMLLNLRVDPRWKNRLA
jgi:hypothetical protein